MSTIGGINLGNLTNYLLFFADGGTDANWQGATKGFVGDVAVDGIQASERTSGDVPYAGTLYTNAATQGAWQSILSQNVGQATGSVNEVSRVAGLEADLINAIAQINALPATPGYTSVSSAALNGLNTQNGINEVFVINITSDLNFSSKINITGDPGDVFILRWDDDGNPNNGYQGQVKPQSGGAIVPLGGLTPANFINVAGDINSSGGGANPLPPYPQGPRFANGHGALIDEGSDFKGGGFFTGYWLTTGSPTTLDPGSGLYYGETSPLSNGIFVGGWYTITTKFSMTSGTSGVYVSPNPATITNPAIDIKKQVSPDGGLTWFDADVAPGPTITPDVIPQFRFIVTNTGNVTLSNVIVTDNVLGSIGTLVSLAPGGTHQWIVLGTWSVGPHVNLATATGVYAGVTYTDTDPAHYFGAIPSINIKKYVSGDNGVTWIDANTPTGPIISSAISPQFKFVVTNTGIVNLTNVVVTDDVFGPIGTVPNLAPAGSNQWIITDLWAAGQHVNTATATGQHDGVTYTGTDPAYYFGADASINIEKDISLDGGVTWLAADSAPGPTVNSSINPEIRFRVTNTGIVTLTNVTVTDDVFGPIGNVASLAPGSSAEWVITATWVAGQHVNLATATGTYNGVNYTDTNPMYYFGGNVAINLTKYISVDGGVTWLDSETPPGPFITSAITPQFRFVVTNIGTITLTNVVVTDSDFGAIGNLASLPAGGSNQWIISVPWAVGQHENTATAVGTANGATVTDTDKAHYFGENPAIHVIKYVSADNGVTWQDAETAPGPIINSGTNPQFLFKVTNIGNVTLTNIGVTDSVFGAIGNLASLVPGQSDSWIQLATWTAGQHENTATATGVFDGITYTDTDQAHYLGATPSVQIKKYISPDGGVTWLDAETPAGPNINSGTNPQYKFVVTNTGNVTLENVIIMDSDFGLIGNLASLGAGVSVEWMAIGTWTVGQNQDTATVTSDYNGQIYTDTDQAHYVGVNAHIMIVKYVSVDNGITWLDANTPPGPLLPSGVLPQFKFVISNTGSVTFTNIIVTDSILGVIGTLISLPPGGSFQWIV